MARRMNVASRTWALGLMTAVALAATSLRPVHALATPGPMTLLPAGLPMAPPAAVLADGPGQQRIIDAVEKRYGAKVVRVTETSVNGRAALELRLLSDQRVWNVVVDAETGQELARN